MALTALGMGLKSNMPREQKGAGLFELLVAKLVRQLGLSNKPNINRSQHP
jgi:hypothetical protein